MNILVQLFLSFFQIGLFSIGGGYAVIPLIKEHAVDLKGWLSIQEFTDIITISQMTPGPIAINAATFVGIRIAGIAGAAAATLGCIFPSFLIVSFLAFLYYKYKGGSFVSSVMSSLRPAVVALIAAAGLSMLNTAVFNGRAASIGNLDVISAALFLLAFLLLRTRKWNPILVMCLCGAANLAIGTALQ